jgi:hypothetical protein
MVEGTSSNNLTRKSSINLKYSKDMQTCSFNGLNEGLITVDAAIIKNKDRTLAGEWRHVGKLEPGAKHTLCEFCKQL